jgi:hypothetical protein
VADIFQEVDEEVRRERLKKLWERYGSYAIAGAVALVLAVAAWRGYEWWVAKQAAQFGDAFMAATKLSEDGKYAEAESAFARVAAEGTSNYRVLARLSQAGDLAATDRKAAVAAYDAIAADHSVAQPLRDLATIRSALLLVDTAPLSELSARLEPLTGPDGTFRHTARELLALAAWRNGDMSGARRWVDMIVADPETPESVRSRIGLLRALLPASARS